MSLNLKAFSLACLVWAAACGAALAADAPKNLAQIDRCLNGRDALTRLWSCTAQLNGAPLGPQDAAQYHLSRGYSFLALGWREAALRDFARTLALAPQTLEVYNVRIAIYRGQGDHARATADLSALIAQSPQEPLLYIQRASLHESQGAYEEAIADTSSALSIAQSYEPIAEFYLQRAQAYEMAARYDDALRDVDKALARNGDQAGGLLARGRLLYLKGDWAGAKAALSRALALENGNVYAAIWLYLAHMRLGAPVAAIDLPPVSGVADLWPRIMLSVLTGERAVADALPAAFILDKARARLAKSKICELSYFQGERLLAQGAQENAARYFREAVETGVSGTLDARGAQLRLAQIAQGAEAPRAIVAP